jgi:surface polysaccharide O-acyltransferase-like enzyme
MFVIFVTCAIKFSLVSMSDLFALAMLAWCRVLEHITQLILLLTEPNKHKEKNQNSNTNANGQIWKVFQDAHFEPLWFFFAKLNLHMFLPIIQEHIKMITLVLTNLAESFSNAYNKQPK